MFADLTTFYQLSNSIISEEKPLLVVTGPSSIFASSGAEWIQSLLQNQGEWTFSSFQVWIGI